MSSFGNKREGDVNYGPDGGASTGGPGEIFGALGAQGFGRATAEQMAKRTVARARVRSPRRPPLSGSSQPQSSSAFGSQPAASADNAGPSIFGNNNNSFSFQAPAVGNSNPFQFGSTATNNSPRQSASAFSFSSNSPFGASSIPASTTPFSFSLQPSSQRSSPYEVGTSEHAEHERLGIQVKALPGMKYGDAEIATLTIEQLREKIGGESVPMWAAHSPFEQQQQAINGISTAHNGSSQPTTSNLFGFATAPSTTNPFSFSQNATSNAFAPSTTNSTNIFGSNANTAPSTGFSFATTTPAASGLEPASAPAATIFGATSQPPSSMNIFGSPTQTDQQTKPTSPQDQDMITSPHASATSSPVKIPTANPLDNVPQPPSGGLFSSTKSTGSTPLFGQPAVRENAAAKFLASTSTQKAKPVTSTSASTNTSSLFGKKEDKVESPFKFGQSSTSSNSTNFFAPSGSLFNKAPSFSGGTSGPAAKLNDNSAKGPRIESFPTPTPKTLFSSFQPSSGTSTSNIFGGIQPSSDIATSNIFGSQPNVGPGRPSMNGLHKEKPLQSLQGGALPSSYSALIPKPDNPLNALAIVPPEIPSWSDHTLEEQYVFAYRLSCLDSALKHHLRESRHISADLTFIEYYNKIRHEILEQALKSASVKSREKKAETDRRSNGFAGQSKHTTVNGSVPQTEQRPELNHNSSPKKKRKAEEQITKDTYDVNGDIDEQSTSGSISYPNLSSSQQATQPSKTSQLFASVMNGAGNTGSASDEKSGLSQHANLPATKTVQDAKAKSPIKSASPFNFGGTTANTSTPSAGSNNIFAPKTDTGTSSLFSKPPTSNFNFFTSAQPDVSSQSSNINGTAAIAKSKRKATNQGGRDDPYFDSDEVEQQVKKTKEDSDTQTSEEDKEDVTTQDKENSAPPGKSLFDRVEIPSKEVPQAGNSSSSQAPGQSLFNFGNSATTNAPASSFLFKSTAQPSTPEKQSNPFSFTPTTAPQNPFAERASQSSTSPSDQTWKPETPIKFGTSTTNAPEINVTAASPAPPSTSKPSSVLFGATSKSPFTGFGGPTSSSGGSKASTPAPAVSTVGFNFGGPPKPANVDSLTTPSNNTSRATSPGASTGAESTGHNSDDEYANDEQIKLDSASAGEEAEDVLFEEKAKALEYLSDRKEWKGYGVGTFRLLKHKSTGQTRVLMRQQGIGKIVLNAALMSGIKYEFIKPKGVKLAIVGGKGTLVTWMVRFGKEEKAQELSELMEKNKGL
ncbi:hypothetical protein MMC25_003280 [Agyrium rufum]|nr:hypothetical protein [Agyrium rufum]